MLKSQFLSASLGRAKSLKVTHTKGPTIKIRQGVKPPPKTQTLLHMQKGSNRSYLGLEFLQEFQSREFLGFKFQWRVFALSASEAIFRART